MSDDLYAAQDYADDAALYAAGWVETTMYGLGYWLSPDKSYCTHKAKALEIMNQHKKENT